MNDDKRNSPTEMLVPRLEDIIYVDSSRGKYPTFHLRFDNGPFADTHLLTRFDKVNEVVDLSVYRLLGGVDTSQYELVTEVDDESIFKQEENFFTKRAGGGKYSFTQASRLPVARGDRLVVKVLKGLKYKKMNDADKVLVLSGNVEEILRPSDILIDGLEFKLSLKSLGHNIEELYDLLFKLHKETN